MSQSAAPNTPEKPKSPIAEIVQPFVDLVRAPRALWGINLTYFLEGLVYFGMLGYLAMFFNESVGLNDQQAGWMVGVLTYGITFSMFFFGGLADKWGVRVALLLALVMMFAGRVMIAAGPSLGLPAGGMGSSLHLLVMGGILLIVLGYGMYQPAAYAAVRQFTTPATAGMGYAMLYALMNLGGWLPSFAFLLRDKEYAGLGIPGVYWVYTGLTIVGLLLTSVILTRKVVARAIADAKAATPNSAEADAKAAADQAVADREHADRSIAGRVWHWLKNHPLADAKFSFFIFCLIPVQTLFAHNWLTLPMYVERAYAGSWIGQNFELATNFNPLLIFILVPVVTALTQKRKIYDMMIAGTFVMAAPTFLLAIGPSFWTLFGYLVLMTIGEAMWQPRFLQFAAEIAPPGRTGAYMGVAQFPWFLTKVITSLYSGWFLMNYCPEPGAGPLNTESMWFIYGLIALSSTVMLVVAKPWAAKGMKERH